MLLLVLCLLMQTALVLRFKILFTLVMFTSTEILSMKLILCLCVDKELLIKEELLLLLVVHLAVSFFGVVVFSLS